MVLAIFVIGLLILIYFWKKRSENAQNSDNFHDLEEEDAIRFARLIAIEIKLYNEYKLQKGLRNNNIYGALETEIGNARKKYLKRFNNFFSHSVLKEQKLTEYFNDQLIQVLAEGDESKMGLANGNFSKLLTP